MAVFGVLFAVWTALGVASTAEAQSAPSTIAGEVVDATGAVLPGATVVLTNSRTGRERVVVTDATGRFVADQMVPGSYKLTVTLSGFEPLDRDGVDVGEGATTQVRLALGLSTLEDSVVDEARRSTLRAPSPASARPTASSTCSMRMKSAACPTRTSAKR